MDQAQKLKLIDWASYIRRLKAMPECQVQARPVPKVPIPKLDLSFIEEDEIAAARKAVEKAIRRKEIRAYKSRITEMFRVYGGPRSRAGPKVREAGGVVLPAKVGTTGTGVKKDNKKVKKRSTIVELPFIF